MAASRWSPTARCSGSATPTGRSAYRRHLVTAGFDTVTETWITYTDDLTFAQLVGGLYSAMSAEQLPRGTERARFEAQLRRKVDEVVTEEITVAMLVGRTHLALQQEFRSPGTG